MISTFELLIVALFICLFCLGIASPISSAIRFKQANVLKTGGPRRITGKCKVHRVRIEAEDADGRTGYVPQVYYRFLEDPDTRLQNLADNARFKTVEAAYEHLLHYIPDGTPFEFCHFTRTSNWIPFESEPDPGNPILVLESDRRYFAAKRWNSDTMPIVDLDHVRDRFHLNPWALSEEKLMVARKILVAFFCLCMLAFFFYPGTWKVTAGQKGFLYIVTFVAIPLITRYYLARSKIWIDKPPASPYSPPKSLDPI